MTAKRPKTNAIEKSGVRYVQNIVESANCIFHPIHGENDVGIDAIIELVDNEKVSGTSVGVQIKSGQSYFKKKHAVIPATKNQIQYWKNHTLPILGIVFNADMNIGYWVDISGYIKANREIFSLKSHNFIVEISDVTEFSRKRFEEIFIPLFVKKPLNISFDESYEWAYSPDFEKHALGIGTLFHKYFDNDKIWEVFIDIFKKRNINELDPYLVYILAHIPGHADMFWRGDHGLTPKIRSSLLSEVNSFGVLEVYKLLQMVDENGFERGSIGQNIDSLINVIGERDDVLLEIINNDAFSTEIIENASLLIAHYSGVKCLPQLKLIFEKSPSTYNFLGTIITELEDNGAIYLY